MRTAAICPTCATYENALCIIYNGPYLSNIDVAPLDALPTTGATDWSLVLSVPATGAPQYANNAAAVFAGLSVGQVYRTGDLLKIVH